MAQRLIRAAFWAAALFSLVMASLPRPPRMPGDPGDKVLHLVAFATLAALAAAGYRRTPLLLILAGLSAYGLLIELIQLIPALGRDAEIIDWVADTLAAGAVLLLAALIRRRFPAA
jgi:VanZ family protein